MDVICKGRGTGKTRDTIILSSKKQIPILCYNERGKNVMLNKAHEMGYDIPEPIIFSFETHEAIKDKQDVIIDDIDVFLSATFPRYKIKSATITPDNLHLKMSFDG